MRVCLCLREGERDIACEGDTEREHSWALHDPELGRRFKLTLKNNI